ncbi:MAG: transcription-repair coupling factor, partial [Ilumatobacteraceae bacterium]
MTADLATDRAVSPPLVDLPALLRDEPGLTRALGEPDARLAIVDVARPISIAALSHLSSAAPLVVACPTGSMAGQLADDLAQYVGADQVALYPAWETLPFERVSPAVETMGRRLELLWRLRDPARSPRIVVAGVYPSTADAPIRIDLWGDEVDRLTTFAVNDQRSVADLAEVTIFPARELTLDDTVRRRAAELVGAEPWGREHWERLAEGAQFDGMESWVPWLTDTDTLITDVLPARAKV